MLSDLHYRYKNKDVSKFIVNFTAPFLHKLIMLPPEGLQGEDTSW